MLLGLPGGYRKKVNLITFRSAVELHITGNVRVSKQHYRISHDSDCNSSTTSGGWPCATPSTDFTTCNCASRICQQQHSLLLLIIIIIIIIGYYYSHVVIFTAQCTLVQSAVLRSHVVRLSICPSVRLSVTLVDCDHIGWKSWKVKQTYMYRQLAQHIHSL